jgi:uncharacterized protein
MKAGKEIRKDFKILCISDDKDPLVYCDSIKTRFKDIDFVISAGDLPFYYYEFIVSSLNKPLFFVFGNHNLKRLGEYKRKYRYVNFSDYDDTPSYMNSVGATFIGCKVHRKTGLLMAGLGGSKWYNGMPNQFTELGMFINILKIIPGLLWNRIFYGRYLDIFVSHAPPFGINDKPDMCHTGFKIFLWFLRKFRPKYHLHGHIHIYNRNKKRDALYLETNVINVYNHYLLEIKKGDKVE